MSVLKELAVKHPYYCSESNYYSNDGQLRYTTMSEFLDDFEEADVDMNLCFRWDIRRKTDGEDNELDGYEAEVFLMLQRKGIFRPILISSVLEAEAVRFKAYAIKHLDNLKAIWAPLA